MNSTSGVDQILGQIRALRQQTPTVRSEAPAALEGSKPLNGFADLFKQSIEAVKKTDETSGQLKEAFIRGDSTVSLAQVMVASQKADITFRGVVEVRNKMIDAYREVMRMSV